MLVSVPASRCRYGRRVLPVLLSRRAAQRRDGACQFSRSQRSYHAGPQPSIQQDARIRDIRNIGIIAHVDAGKTTTTELMLYTCGLTRHFGKVDHGDTVTDFLELERERGITIQSAAITFSWPPKEQYTQGRNPTTINLIDTPGHQDFRFEVDRCMPVLDGAICILDSVKGVEAHTERVWASAQLYRIPRLIYINKLDRDGASFRRSVLDVASRLGSWPLLCQIPWWDHDNFVGVIDIVDMTSIQWTGTSTKRSALVENGNPMWTEAVKARAALIESLCDHDEEMMDDFIKHDKDIPASSIKRSIRKLIRDGSGKVVPILAGASLRGMGAEPLLDAVVDYLPSPQDKPEIEIQVASERHTLRELLEKSVAGKHHGAHRQQHQSPVAAVATAFKVVNDPFRGMLTFVRVYHGSLHRNSSMWNPNRHVFEKSLNMLQISGAQTHDIPQISTGSIGALTGLKHARTGDTLISFAGNKAPGTLKSVHIRPPEIPPAVAFIAIYPFALSGAKNLEIALENASREDPSLRWTHDEKSGQFILSGMGALHLEICQDRLRKFYKVEADFGRIEVDYKECLVAPTGPHRHEYDRIVAGKQGRAACTASLEPLASHHRETLMESKVERDGNLIHIHIPLPTDGSELEFDPEVVRQQLFNGAVAALARGPRRGSPVHGCHVSITYDPKTDVFRPSTGAHIVGAATHAVRGALREAHARSRVAILEPFMRLRLRVPEDVGSAVQHDLSSARGGVVLEVNDLNSAASSEGLLDLSKVYVPPDPYESIQSLRGPKKGMTRMLEIIAKVPLKEVLEYDGHLRSLTAGRHSLHMELDTFERVSSHRERGLDMP